MKITLWIPAAEDPKWPCVLSWLQMEYPDGAQMRFKRSGPNDVFYAWNDIVREFLADGDDWLFSSHNDVEFLPQTFMRLLSWDKPLVSALVFMRKGVITPHVWNGWDEDKKHYKEQIMGTRRWLLQHKELIKHGPCMLETAPADALTPIDFTSTSCCIIHRSVVEKMSFPWFKWHDPHKGGGEDFFFFHKAKKAGFQAYVDRSVIAGHMMNGVAASAADFMAWEQSTEFVGGDVPPKYAPPIPAAEAY